MAHSLGVPEARDLPAEVEAYVPGPRGNPVDVSCFWSLRGQKQR
jgi:hypothetical protein